MNIKNLMEAVIFDFDGLIIDSESPRFRAWRRTYRQFGQRLTLADYALNVGSDDSRFDFKKNLELSVRPTHSVGRGRCGPPLLLWENDVDDRAFSRNCQPH
jgi:hypothetical protein